MQHRRPCTAEEGHRAECGSAQREGDYLYQKIKISLSLPKRSQGFEFEPVVRSLTGSSSAPIKLEGMVINKFNQFLANDLNAVQFRFIYIAPNLKAVV